MRTKSGPQFPTPQVEATKWQVLKVAINQRGPFHFGTRELHELASWIPASMAIQPRGLGDLGDPGLHSAGAW